MRLASEARLLEDPRWREEEPASSLLPALSHPLDGTQGGNLEVSEEGRDKKAALGFAWLGAEQTWPTLLLFPLLAPSCLSKGLCGRPRLHTRTPPTAAGRSLHGSVAHLY